MDENITTESAAATAAAAAAVPEEQQRLFSLAEMDEAVAQARREGYLQGCNERLDTLIRQPGQFANPVAEPAVPAASAPDADTGFLRYLRPSVWD